MASKQFWSAQDAPIIFLYICVFLCALASWREANLFAAVAPRPGGLFRGSGPARLALHGLGLLHQGRLGSDQFLRPRIHQFFPVKQGPFGVR